MKTIGYLALSAVGLILSGWAFSTLWGWFVVPAFGIAQINIGQALGIALTVKFLTYRPDVWEEIKDRNDKEKQAKRLFSAIWSIAAPLTVLAFGWLYLQFV